MNEEIWKDIPGYEGLYQVSNMGRVKSLKYGKEKIIKPVKNRDGYLLIGLYKNNKVKHYTMHRLVAIAFIGKPISEVYYEINHLDENKNNNKLENLQYCTRKYNCNYGSHNEKMSKSVIGINKINGFICEYSSARGAGRSLLINNANIVACCKGKLKSAGGYVWYYKEDYKECDK